LKKSLIFVLTFIFVILVLASCVKTSRKIDYPTPSNKQTIYSTDITLIWDHFEAFDYFEIRLAESDDLLTTIGTTTENRYELSDLDWNRDYNWQIIGHLNATNTTAGPVWQFSTGNAHKAITIGITDYDTASDLSLTDDDALNMETAFERANLNFSISRLINRVTQADIEQAVSNISGLDEDSLFVFTYAGHGGYSYSAHESYLLMSDGGKLYMSELRPLLDTLPGKKVVIIDACESGGFINMAEAKQLTEKTAKAMIRQFNDSVIDTFRSTARGEDVEVTYHVMTATSISEISWENSLIGNGVFSFFFLDGIGDVGEDNPQEAFDFTFDADTNSDRKVTFQEAYTYTAPKVETFVSKLMGYHQSVQVYPEVSDLILSQW